MKAKIKLGCGFTIEVDCDIWYNLADNTCIPPQPEKFDCQIHSAVQLDSNGEPTHQPLDLSGFDIDELSEAVEDWFMEEIGERATEYKIEAWRETR